jgi:serine/threonine protein kinase
MKVVQVCFDASTVKRLLNGKLSGGEVEAVTAHLERCDTCVRMIRAIPEDSLVEAMSVARSLPAQSAGAGRLNSFIGKVLNLRSGNSSIGGFPLETKHSAGQPPASAPRAEPLMMMGRYRIVRELGRGGMGTVYEAEDSQLRRRVALKVPTFDGSGDKQDQMRQRFLREARSAATVDHPNVCKIYDVGEQDGKPFVVMAFIDGKSLAEKLPKGRVKDRDAVQLIIRIAEGLLAVHAHGIVHRDLKPANIMLKGNTPILMDFGLAHVHTDSAHLTGDGALLGTPAYMAPEQAVPDLGPVTVRTDVYSLAVVLFQMLTGRLPLELPMMQIVGYHLSGRPLPAASEFHRGVDPSLNAILQKAMARQPAERHADVRGFADELRGWLRSAPPRPSAGSSLSASRKVNAPPSGSWDEVAAGGVVEAAALPINTPLPIRPTTVDEAPVPRRSTSRTGMWVKLAAVAFLAGGTALGVIIVRDRMGKETGRIEVPEGGSADYVSKDKKPKVVSAKDEGKAKPGDVFIDEDFRKPFDEAKTVPDRWKDEANAFAVFKDERGRTNLQVTAKTGDYFVTLPPLPLNGDFAIEVEYLIGGGANLHKLTISLEGDKVAERLPIVIEHTGRVTIADGAPRQELKYKPETVTQVLIERKDKTLLVSLNGERAAVKGLNGITKYETVRIGLTAGMAYGSSTVTTAKLYSIKVGLPKR